MSEEMDTQFTEEGEIAAVAEDLQRRYKEVCLDIWRIAFNKYQEGVTSDAAKTYAKKIARRQHHHWGLTRDQIEWAWRMAFFG
jgi:hypothetical protein